MDSLTEKSRQVFVESSINFERYDRERCIRKNGPCYRCQVYALECPEVVKALYESVRQLGLLTRHENALVAFDILDE